MGLLSTNRYYALNGRTVDLLMKGDIDMSVVTDNDTDNHNRESDEDFQDLLGTETGAGFFVVGENKTCAGRAFSIFK